MSGLFRLSAYVIALMLLPGMVFGQIDDPIPTRILPSNTRITLTEAASGLTAPIWGTSAPGVAGRLFVADQVGLLLAVNTASATPNNLSIFLDLTARLVAASSTCNERGLLGVAFHAQYTTPGAAGFGRLYTYTSEPVSAAGPPHFSTLAPGERADHQSVIIEWQVADPLDDTAIVDLGSARVLLRIDQPQCNKNAGGLSFGPAGDEHLYIALGDGGSVDDQGPGHGETGNGQRARTVLGAILRIDPTASNPPNGRYGIPADNPFARNPSIPDELYAYGFQNPSRLSFDPSGLIYTSDAGQLIQEVNIVIADGNYGWNQKEGTFAFDPNGLNDGFLIEEAPNDPVGIVDPVAQYDRDEGGTVVGGFVYGDGEVAALFGRYVFGETGLPSDRERQCHGRLLVLKEVFDFGQELTEDFVRENDPLVRSAIADLGQGLSALDGLCILGFDRDDVGEIYVLANATGTPLPDAAGNATGVVMKISAP